MALSFNEVTAFMKNFGVEFINGSGDLIIHEKSNTYTFVDGCTDLKDVEMRVVFALCRPVGKSLNEFDAGRLLSRLNNYFDTDLTREDMLMMYQHLCYRSEFERFKDFIKRGFPVHELKEKATTV